MKYQHINSGTYYWKLGEVSFKIPYTKVWVTFVKYTSCGTEDASEHLYMRTLRDFNRSFKKV